MIISFECITGLQVCQIYHNFFIQFQTFIYLFAPICNTIRESDFSQNIRLENGKQIWQALWEYRHPDAEGFIAPVSIHAKGENSKPK